MGKKEASKGRDWEKDRRDVLNQTFWELHKALPNYVEGQTISKKAILIQAIDCIHQFQKEEQQGEVQVLQKWMQHVLEKFSQLLTFLDSASIKVPADYLSLDTPPCCMNPCVSKLVMKIGKFGSENNSENHRNVLSRKQKAGGRKKVNIENGNTSSTSHCASSTSEKDEAIRESKGTQCQNLKSDFNSSVVTNPSIIQNNPVVVQSSSLQMPSRLLFASNTSSSPLSSTLPLLVSVTGVKTVNPFILVQSNVVAPNPLTHNAVNVRPIQPGPPSKASKKIKKMPIPSLKQKAALSHILPQCSSKKPLNQNGKIVSKLSGHSNKGKPNKKCLEVKHLAKPAKVTGTLDENGLKAPSMKNKDDLSLSEGQTPITITNTEEKSSKITSGVNKENESACVNTSSKLQADGNKASPFLSPTIKEATIVSEILDQKGEDADANSILTAVEPQLKNENSYKTTDVGNIASVKKRLCDIDINSDIAKRQKCSTKPCTADEPKSNEDISSNCEINSCSSVEGSSLSKPSKSNYSILAICAEQELLQSTDIASQTTEEIGQEIHQVNSSELSSSKQHTVECSLEIPAREELPLEKSNSCYASEKSKEAASTLSEHFSSEWSDKSKFKSDRMCSNSNIFSSLPLHNSKNTFIPISDMDNFKAVPETFDSGEGTFGLPMHSSDISNDIFASLQVPSGGQHPESISPTAAFLLAFPLVSTSKATELLSDDTVCENNDSQPGMKTILQIGNLDCDTPVTKCVSEFSSIEGSNVVYSSTSIFNHNTVPITIAKSKSLDPTVDRSFEEKDLEDSLSHKCSSNSILLPLKENANFPHKNPEPVAAAALKGSQSFAPKNIYQPLCSNSNKQDCQSRNEPISTVSSHLNDQLSDSRVQNKTNRTDLSNNILYKKLNESSTFLVCEKQSDWMDIPHSSHGSYPEFLTPSVPRSDCAVNYVLPPVLMSSSTGGEELPAIPKHQGPASSSGIFSWSTISPSENAPPSKQTPRLGHFQDMFPSLKSSNRAVDLQQSAPNHSITPSGSNQSHLPSGSIPGSLLNNKLTPAASNFSQNHHILKPNDHGLSGEKHSAPSNSFVLSGCNPELKKSFSVSESKLVECNSSEVLKVSSNTSESGMFAQQQPNARQGNSQASSTPIVYPQSEAKQVKASNIYFADRTSSENIKSGINAGMENHNSKQPNNLLNYNQSSVVTELKQPSAVSNYNHEPNLSIKENEITNYHHQTNIPKQLGTATSQFSTGVTASSSSKKHVIHYNIDSEPSVDVSKQTASGNFGLESTSSMMHFSSNAVNPQANHQEGFNSKSNSHEAQQMKPQASQHRQQCSRSSKESVGNLHRPPVNWMTAPDIRSHQHHSGPSFGNNSNMNNTQGMLYLPDHSKDIEGTAIVFDQSSNFHCLDITHPVQPLFKGNELHLFGNENIENFHDSSAWSPNKNGSSSMLGNMMIPSTLPTLVGDLALGDNNISRPFLPSYANDLQSCHKKPVKRSLNASRRAEKAVDDTGAVVGQECAGSFLSVSQLVNPGGASKSRSASTTNKESNISYPGSFSSHDTAVCQSSKQNSVKAVSSNYSTEALLSSNMEQITQNNHRKRRSHGTHYPNNFVGGSVSYQNCGTLPAQGPQTQFLTDLPPHRSNDYQGTFLHSDGVPTFMIANPSRGHRNHSYTLQNISDRSSIDDNSHTQRTHHSGITETSVGRHHRTSINNSVNNASTTATVSSSSNIMDFGYINMPSAVPQDDISFTNHPPAPPFLSHHSYPIPPQDTLYTTPRLSMHPTHPSQNSSIQSPSATTLTNFHLSTIFPGINDKVVC